MTGKSWCCKFKCGRYWENEHVGIGPTTVTTQENAK